MKGVTQYGVHRYRKQKERQRRPPVRRPKRAMRNNPLRFRLLEHFAVNPEMKVFGNQTSGQTEIESEEQWWLSWKWLKWK